MKLTDEKYLELKNDPKLKDFTMIKEYQMWGYCPTWKNLKTDELLFTPAIPGEGRVFWSWEEMKNDLKDNWCPVREEEILWALANLE